LSTESALLSEAPHSLGATHFLLRRLHSLTGIVFGLYVCVHLLVNATLIEGVRSDGTISVFQLQVDKIHSLPFLSAVEWVFIYLPILYHTIYGIYIVVTGQPNVGTYRYGKNMAYFFQRVSAMILVLFIAFHVLAMKQLFGAGLGFNAVSAADSTARHLQYNWVIGYVVYPIGILAACFHLANGFWTASVTWGLSVSAQAQRRWGGVCVLIFLFTLGCGMTALIGGLSRSLPTAPPVPMLISGAH
jgi:succinate dehydrogenase / fumarate reductase cytochrome b subunit